LPERDHEVAVVLEGRWGDRKRQAALLREEPDRVAADGRLDRAAFLLEVGEQLAVAAGIEARPRQRGRADLAPLVEQRHRQLERRLACEWQAGVVAREQLPQADGGREPGR